MVIQFEAPFHAVSIPGREVAEYCTLLGVANERYFRRTCCDVFNLYLLKSQPFLMHVTTFHVDTGVIVF